MWYNKLNNQFPPLGTFNWSKTWPILHLKVALRTRNLLGRNTLPKWRKLLQVVSDYRQNAPDPPTCAQFDCPLHQKIHGQWTAHIYIYIFIHTNLICIYIYTPLQYKIILYYHIPWINHNHDNVIKLIFMYVSIHDSPLLSIFYIQTEKKDHSGQIIIFHQPRFPWNKGISLTKPPFGVRSCEVAIIWPDSCMKNIHDSPLLSIFYTPWSSVPHLTSFHIGLSLWKATSNPCH